MPIQVISGGGGSAPVVPVGPVVGTMSRYGTLANTIIGFGSTATTNVAFPVANTAFFYPFSIDEDATVAQIGWVNGNVVSGNIDVGIYTRAGAKVISTGSTAQSGTSVIQAVNVADTALAAGDYYFAVSMDNTTGTLLGVTAIALGWMQQAGAMQEATSFPLPATWTAPDTTPDNHFMPWLAFNQRSVGW